MCRLGVFFFSFLFFFLSEISRHVRKLRTSSAVSSSRHENKTGFVYSAGVAVIGIRVGFAKQNARETKKSRCTIFVYEGVCRGPAAGTLRRGGGLNSSYDDVIATVGDVSFLSSSFLLPLLFLPFSFLSCLSSLLQGWAKKFIQ